MKEETQQQNSDAIGGSVQRSVRRRGSNADDLPNNWEDCTKPQLECLLEHGTQSQRLIAERYLRLIAIAHQARTAEKEWADKCRAMLKSMGPNQRGEIGPQKCYDRYGDGVDYGDY